jgi:hypothetical protein
MDGVARVKDRHTTAFNHLVSIGSCVLSDQETSVQPAQNGDIYPLS